MLNTALSFLAAPFLGILVTAPIFSALLGEFQAWGLFFVFGLTAAYFSTLAFGLPQYLVLRTMKVEIRAWHCLLAGLVASIPAVVQSLAGAEVAPSLTRTVLVIAFIASTGALSGLAFWVVHSKLARESKDTADRNAKSAA